MAADAVKTIRVVIDSSGAEIGAQRSVAAMNRIRTAGSSTGASNDNLSGSFNRVGKSISGIGEYADGLSGSYNRLAGAARGTASANDNAASSMSRLSGNMASTEGAVGRLTNSFSALKATLLGLGVGVAALAFMKLSDEAGSISAKLNLATSKFGSFAQANADVVSISNRTRTSITATADLYSVLARNADTLKLKQSDVATATGMVGKVLKISGANAQQTAASILQLSQALGSGKLAGDEFASLAENAPRLMNLLAESMGVPRGALKKLASEGKITADKITKALTDPKMVAEIEKEFGKIPVSFGDIKTAAWNTAIQVAGAFSRGFGISDSLAVALAKVQSWAASMVPVFEGFGRGARAALTSIQPTLQAIGSTGAAAFSFITSNGPQIISIIKTATVAWLAYRSAVIAATVITSLPGAFLALGIAVEAATARVVAMTIALRGLSLAGIGTFFTELAAGVVLFGQACLAAVPEIGAMAAALWATGIPEVIIAITALVGAIYWLATSTYDVGGKVVSGWDIIKATFAGGVTYIASVWEDLKTATVSAWNDVSKFISDHMDVINGILISVPALWPIAIIANWDKIASYTQTAWNAVSNFVRTYALQILQNIPILGPIVTTISRYWDDIVAASDRIWARVVSVIKNHIYEILNSIPLIGGAVAQAYAYANSASGQKAAGAAKGAFDKSIADSDLQRRTDKLNASTGVWDGNKLAGWVDARTPRKPMVPVVTPPAAPKADKGKSHKDDAAERAKREKEFWDTLKGEVATASMLPPQAEAYRKQLELRKILGHDLSAMDVAAINAEIRKKDIGEITKATATQQLAAEIANVKLKEQSAMIGKGTVDQQTENLAIEEKLWPLKQKQLELGLSLDDAAFKSQLRMVEQRERENYELDKRNKLLQDGQTKALAYAKAAYGATPDGKKAAATTTRDTMLDALKALRDNGTISGKEFDAAVKKAGADFDAAVKKTGDTFAKKLAGVLNQWGDAIGGKLGEIIGKLGSVSDAFGGFKANSDSMSKSVSSLFGDPNSALAKGIGKSVGGAFAGLQIGEQIAGLGKALGLKGGETGAKIGGAIGGLTGNPLIALGASILGSIVGSLFYKAPKGQATITNTGVQLSGTSAALKQQASGMAGDVQSSLANIATQLGASIGAFKVSIGTYKDKIRVNPTGGAVGGVKGSGAISYASEAEAVKAAVQFAITQGALQGLSDFGQKAVKALDIDSAITLITDFKNAMADYAALTDPVSAAVHNVTDSLDTLRASMVKVGASSTDLTKLDQYRALKLDQALKDETKSFRDILDSLNGNAGGFTALSQLTDEMTQFSKFKADIAAGKSVNQDDYSTLVNKIIGNLGDVYGTNTTDYQSAVSSIRDTTNAGLLNVTNAFNSASGSTTDTTSADNTTVDAINAQTDAITTQQSITNDYLRQILAKQSSGGSSVDYSGSGIRNAKALSYD